MENIKSPISKVALALKMRSEGLGLRATGRVLGADKHTITRWEKRFAAQKSTLMLYALCHGFISLTFEGDELYTIVGKRTDPSDSKGWTAIIMERGSRFIVEQKCGEKDAGLFKAGNGKSFSIPLRNQTILLFYQMVSVAMVTCFSIFALRFCVLGSVVVRPMFLPTGVRIRVTNKGKPKTTKKGGRKRAKGTGSLGRTSDTAGYSFQDPDFPCHSSWEP